MSRLTHRLSHRLHVALVVSAAAALSVATYACGGISDPTLGTEAVASVSGALTGSAVPANARVALVYRLAQNSGNTPAIEVGSDVAVVGGKFKMNLGPPASRLISAVEDKASSGSASGSGSGGASPEEDTSAPAPVPQDAGAFGASSSSSSGGGAFGANVSKRDLVGGGITQPLSAAIAGFIVYADTNGNEKLDLEGEYGSSPDEILGGSTDLMLVYLKDGGTLDYEKLRDTSSIVPIAGFNLWWSSGRWLPLNAVELKLGTKTLPNAVCSSGGSSATVAETGSFGESPSPPPVATDAGAGYDGPYPSPTDPGLRCAPDGTSFTYTAPSNCPPATPAPVGLCASEYDYRRPACTSGGGYGATLPAGPVPAGWPCPPAATDAGTDGG